MSLISKNAFHHMETWMVAAHPVVQRAPTINGLSGPALRSTRDPSPVRSQFPREEHHDGISAPIMRLTALGLRRSQLEPTGSLSHPRNQAPDNSSEWLPPSLTRSTLNEPEANMEGL